MTQSNTTTTTTILDPPTLLPFLHNPPSTLPISPSLTSCLNTFKTLIDGEQETTTTTTPTGSDEYKNHINNLSLLISLTGHPSPTSLASTITKSYLTHSLTLRQSQQNDDEEDHDFFTLSFLSRVWNYAIRCREDSGKIVKMWVDGAIPDTPTSENPRETGEKVLGPAPNFCLKLFKLLSLPSGRSLTPIEASKILSSYPPSTLPCPNYTSPMEQSHRSTLESVIISGLPPSSLPFSTVSNRTFSTTFISSLLAGEPLQPPNNRQDIDGYVQNVRDPVEIMAAGVFLGR
jgi:hypothetical protein